MCAAVSRGRSHPGTVITDVYYRSRSAGLQAATFVPEGRASLEPVDVTSQFEEADAVEALAPARDRCAQRVLEFMAACGVRVTTPPPQLLELLTAYGFHAIGIGRALGPAKQTIPPDGVGGTAAAERPVDRECSGVLGKLREVQSSLDGAHADSRGEPTRRVLRPLTRNG